MFSSSYRWRQRELSIVLLIGLGVLLLWYVPGLGMLTYPFRLFGTFVHEICHGLMAMVTGGSIQRFEINADLSGVTWSSGGMRWAVTSAGYIGSAIFGGMLLLLSSRGVRAERLLVWLGIGLGLLCLLFVRNLFGIASGLILATALVFAGRRLDPQWAYGLLVVLAIQLILDGFESLLTLVRISAASSITTDAQIMASATGLPPLVWAVVWTGISVVILVVTLGAAYRRY